MAQILTIFNGPATPTAAVPSVATSNVLKTMLQVQADRKFKIIEWGWSADASAAAVPGAVELIDTAAIAATVTAHAAADINKLSDPDAEPVDTILGLVLGTGATGFTATVEGTVTAVRRFDQQLLPPTGPYVKQWPLGREPVVDHDTNLRIRNTFAVTVNAICYVVIEI